MQPLAYRVRPSNFDEVIGQDHLVGKNGIITKMIKNNTIFSMILYGPAGCGKTSIAKIIADMYPLSSYQFNASTDSKSTLKEIADTAKYQETTICVIDEIHRMKKDTQDFLLPYLENGKIILIGLTTENPYRSINPAIRSRCHIYRMNEISKNDIITLLKTLENRCSNYGILIRKIDRYYASSKICNMCGYKKTDLKLSDRTFICPNCGLKIDRDYNAAINIKNYISINK